MRKLYYVIITSFLVLFVLWTCMTGIFGSMCGNDLVSEKLSPNKKYRAVIFVTSCGATTGYYTQVSIFKTERELRQDESGNVLSIDDHVVGNSTNRFGGADVQVEWISNNKIKVKVDETAQINKKENKVNGVEVFYDLL